MKKKSKSTNLRGKRKKEEKKEGKGRRRQGRKQGERGKKGRRGEERKEDTPTIFHKFCYGAYSGQQQSGEPLKGISWLHVRYLLTPHI